MSIQAGDKAHAAIVIKCSLNPGLADIDNELFYQEKTVMLFGSACEVFSELVSE